MNKQWIKQGNDYSFGELPTITEKLPVGIYELNASKFGFFLTYISDSFLLPDKIYDNESLLIERVKKTFNSFDKNFGILLKGLKGTGKTITAKQISNDLKLPVILVNSHFEDMGSFINSIDQDIIIFFDEFEKTYDFSDYNNDDEEGASKKSIGNLLTLMDGVFTSVHKRLFILTTNKEYLPDAIMSRPSRIRYAKDFTDLDYDSIMLILNDIIENKALIPGIVLLLKDLEIVTVDIVKAFAEEANLYDTADKSFFSIFNVKRNEEKFELVMDGKIVVDNFRTINPRVGNSIYMDDDTYYYIVSIKDKKNFTVISAPNWKGISEKYSEKSLLQCEVRKATKTHSSFSNKLELVI